MTASIGVLGLFAGEDLKLSRGWIRKGKNTLKVLHMNYEMAK